MSGGSVLSPFKSESQRCKIITLYNVVFEFLLAGKVHILFNSSSIFCIECM